MNDRSTARALAAGDIAPRLVDEYIRNNPTLVDGLPEAIAWPDDEALVPDSETLALLWDAYADDLED